MCILMERFASQFYILPVRIQMVMSLQVSAGHQSILQITERGEVVWSHILQVKICGILYVEITLFLPQIPKRITMLSRTGRRRMLSSRFDKLPHDFDPSGCLACLMMEIHKQQI